MTASPLAQGIAERLERLQEQIASVAMRCGRRPEEITLVGISKTQPAEAAIEALRAGLQHIGENRVQEAAAKIPSVRQATQGQAQTWHLVGHLQTNKAGAATGLFDRIDSVDSLKLAQALSRRLNGAAELPILVEVYTGDDPGRPGVRPDGLEELVGQISELPNLSVCGLMTVAPLGGNARQCFRTVRALRDSIAQKFPRVHFGVLSMGMSEDFSEAIEEGSTEVRIGTALFGPRQPR